MKEGIAVNQGTGSAGIEFSNEDLLAKSKLRLKDFNKYIDGLDDALKPPALKFVAHTLHHTISKNDGANGDLKELSVPQTLLGLVTKHREVIKAQSNDREIRKEIIQLFLRSELFGGEQPWNKLNPSQRQQIIRGGLTVVGPAILRSIPDQGSDIAYWCETWPVGNENAEELEQTDTDALDTPIPSPKAALPKGFAKPSTDKPSKSEQPAQPVPPTIAQFSSSDLLLKPSSLEWAATSFVDALKELNVETVLDIANIDSQVLFENLKKTDPASSKDQDKTGQKINKKTKSSRSLKKDKESSPDESNVSNFDYLLFYVEYLSETSGRGLKLLITPLSHTSYNQVLSEDTVGALSKIKISKANINQGQIAQSKSSEKIPVNNGLRLLQLLINPEQAGVSDLEKVIQPEEIAKLISLFADVGISDMSSLFAKGEA
jgi:hypothetical protein